MGLAGRKEKQRIGHDPRNLSWADDANKFGTAYLEKLGWSAGSGLGASRDGRTTHVKVHQKLDMLGIGAAHQRDPNGIAWRQNKDFENLLRRLNAGGAEGESEIEASKIDGFTKAIGVKETEMMVDEAAEEVEGKKKRRRDATEAGESRGKSRKPNDNTDEDVEKRERKKQRKEKRAQKKERAKSVTSAEDGVTTEDSSEGGPESPATLSKPTIPVVRPVRAHRARLLASKRLASKSSTAIDEILGISRSASGPSTPAYSTPLTPLETPTPMDDLQELTTSSKSVMDYFKEKLLAKSNATSFASTPTASTPREVDEDDDHDDRPCGRLGLGSARAGIGSSNLRSEVTRDRGEDLGRPRAGLGASALSRMSAMFSASTMAPDAGEIVESAEVEVRVPTEGEAEVESKERKQKKKANSKEKEQEVLPDVGGTREIVKERKERKDKDEGEMETEAEVKEKRSKKGKRKAHDEARQAKDGCAESTIANEELSKKSKKSKRKSDVPDATGVPKAKKEKRDKSGKRAEATG